LNEPHLFEMPIAGYLGFIPFGLSTVVLYAWQLPLRASAGMGIALYAIAIVALYAMTPIYVDKSLWILR
jgi:hypothetical protein